MKDLKLRLTSVSPLVMHNGELANPFNEFTQKIKKISGKRGKTDADLKEMARLEFFGGLYTVNDAVIIPGIAIEAMLKMAARKSKEGKKVETGLYCEDAKLEYKGPRSANKLWDDKKFVFQTIVVVQRSRILRTRPIFPEWKAEVKLSYDEHIMNEEDVLRFAKIAGEIIGLLDWRPKFGRFSAEKIK